LRRKLLVLNVVLAGVVIWGGVRFRQEWLASKARERATLAHRVPAVPAPKFTPSPLDPPITASGYAEIANKMLFDKSRNPVVVEVVPPPPPPPPMPPLPTYHGMMNLGESQPTMFFSQGAAATQPYHIGDMIGQFKLLSVNSVEIVLDWNGQEVHKSIDELSSIKSAPSQEAAAERSAAPVQAAAAPAPPKAGPGDDTGRGFRACSSNDGVADGGVVDGFRKVSYATPFGSACRYEPVK
jgi:hypothetical protein